MRHLIYWIFLPTTMLLAISCQNAAKKEFATLEPSAYVTRDVAEASENVALESKFHSIMESLAPDQKMIEHADTLFTLLMEMNKGIKAFSDELDAKLAVKKKEPSAQIEEPLASPTYHRLLKMWQLRDRYEDEIAWFYMRLIQMRLDSSLNKEETNIAKKVLQNTQTYLRNTRDLERIEFQPLMKKLEETRQKTVSDFMIQRRGQMTDQEDAVAKPAFEKAILTPTQMIQVRSSGQISKTISAPPKLNPRYTKFITQIEKDLSQIPDPVSTAREPQSLQNLACGNSKKLCANTNNSNGNIIGSVFPPGVWAFTYDDGPNKTSTPELLEVLHNHSDPINPVGKATFFWLAREVKRHPDVVQRAAEYGFSLQNHSYDHKDLLNLSSQGRAYEIYTSTRDLTYEYRKSIPDYNIQYFRCPYGSCYAPQISEARQMIAAQGQIHVYWRIDSLDWKLLNGPQVAALVIKQMQLLNHGVILMHDVHRTTVDATKIILRWLKTNNEGPGPHYQLVTIPEAVELVNSGQAH